MPRPLPDRAASFVREIRSFTDELIVPLERELGAHGFVALVPRLNELRSKAKERNLWAPFLPKDLGGQGLTLLEYAHVSEALGVGSS